MKYEWRVCWEASSDASFRGEGDWQEAIGSFRDAEAVEEAMSTASGGAQISEGLAEALEQSGFGWRVEVREAQ